jgi:ferric-dicitrate binding protein FerR (iron transport regulator)
MPAANNGFEPERFASLWAGCDTGNANEAESVNKFRALRRMVAADNLRIVDVMGRADVMQALDAQLQPVREESPQLKEAFGQITQLADALAREREITTDLREELSAAAVAESRARPLPARASHGEVVNGGLVAAVSIVTVVLMIAAVFQSFQ